MQKIQEADYVVIDSTFDNPNVFYEFGLVAALRKKLVPICAGDEHRRREDLLKKLIGVPKLLPYPRFDMLEARIADYVWNLDDAYKAFEQMAGDQITVLYDSKHILRKCL